LLQDAKVGFSGSLQQLTNKLLTRPVTSQGALTRHQQVQQTG
jgi:hypothetical protein